jgi:hypothetical protein
MPLAEGKMISAHGPDCPNCGTSHGACARMVWDLGATCCSSCSHLEEQGTAQDDLGGPGQG